MHTPMESGAFLDVRLDPGAVFEASRRAVIIRQGGEKIIVKNHALSQLLKLAGVKVTEWRRNPRGMLDRVRAGLSGKDIVISAVRVNEGTLVAFRVTTTEYTPIPHRVLFDFAESVIKEAGVSIIEKRVIRFFRRTAMKFVIYEQPLNYARPNDALRVSLIVSNANSADDAIHVYTWVDILACKNGLVIHDIASKHIVHVGNASSILRRVGEAIRDLLAQLNVEELRRKIEALQDVALSESTIQNWLKAVTARLPRKYAEWLQRELRRSTSEFGNTAEAVFQAVTAVASRAKNERVAKTLSKLAYEIITEGNLPQQ